MEAKSLWQQIRRVLRELDPSALAREADRSVCLALMAERKEQVQQMQDFFAPRHLRPRKAEEVRQRLLSFLLPLNRAEAGVLPGCDVVIRFGNTAEEIAALPIPVFLFRPEEPEAVVKAILQERWDLALPLAKNFLPFRAPVQRRWVQSVALENALWAALAAIPQGAGVPYSLTKVVLESRSGSDSEAARLASEVSRPKRENDWATAFLTANQIRLAFLLAASSDSAVGFREQRGQITAVAAAALGLRALAERWAPRRDLAGNLLAEGLLGFLGTYAVGMGIAGFHALGQSFAREEKSALSDEMYRMSRLVLEEVLGVMAARSRSAA